MNSVTKKYAPRRLPQLVVPDICAQRAPAFGSSVPKLVSLLVVGLAIQGLIFQGVTSAQPGSTPAQPAAAATVDSPEAGFLLDVPSPLTPRDVEALVSQLSRWASRGASRQGGAADRTTVVLRLAGERRGETAFEEALKLSRAISGSDLRRLRIVAWLQTPVTGHEVLPVLASEMILVAPDATLGDVTLSQPLEDETVTLNFQAIARRRGLFPPAVVEGLVDPSLAFARVTLADGSEQFAAGETLRELRRSGKVVEESVWSVEGEPLILSADQLRSIRAAAAIVTSQEEVADWLDLATLRSREAEDAGEAVGRLMRISGVIAENRVRRWQSNLAATTEQGEVNTWLVALDSPGGDLPQSAALAMVLAEPGATIQTVGGHITGQARGDAALIAVACRPLTMAPEATLGGGGQESMQPAEIERQRELIAAIASATGRSESLILGLLDSTREIYRYVNRRTGRIRYATPKEMIESAAAEIGDNQDAEAMVLDRWKREQRINLSEPLTAGRAIELGLADGEATDLSAAASATGLAAIPPALADRGLIRFVERIGRNTGLAFLVLLIGFMLLSTEASAPGLGIPGFLAMLCFAFFFWTKFLAGTAEWLELLAFGLGIACLAIEVFVLPGFGVFGFGGLLLTVLGVVLMSQTFVIPRNAYQVGEVTKGIYIALGGMSGLVLGFIAVRAFLPQAALATGLAMGRPEPDQEDAERVARFDDLRGEVGVATTPLRPSGKARFGDRLVAVISDASIIESGRSVRVLDVQGNRVIVEAADE